MSFKKEIIALLKTKFPGVQLSTARVEAIATKIDAKVTTEDEIDGKLDELNELFPLADLAKQDDRLRSLEEEAKKKKPEPPTPPVPPTPPTPPTDEDKDTPAWAKALIESNKTLATDLSALKVEKLTNTRRSSYAESLKGTSKEYQERELKKFDRMRFDTDEEFSEFLTEASDLHAGAIQEEAEQGAGGDRPFAGAGGNSGKVKLATDKELDAVMENL